MDLMRCIVAGHAELDAQQKEFVEKGNVYICAFNAGNHVSHVESTIIYLSDYTKKHFITQEAFMELHAYPGLEKHAAHHGEYVREVAKGFKTLLLYKSNSDMAVLNNLCTNICMLISDWFEFHILQADKRLNEFIHYEINARK
jgi:hemerythrin